MYRPRCLLLMLWYVPLYPRFSMAQNDSMPLYERCRHVLVDAVLDRGTIEG